MGNARIIREWSSYQQAIFNEIANGTGNCHVEAIAGSGKSTSIIEGFYHMKPGLTALMVAFSKPIQLELEARAPSHIQTKTLHAVGLAACKKAFPHLQKFNSIDSKKEKLYQHIKALGFLDSEEQTMIAQTVGLAKGYLAETNNDIDIIIDKHDINVLPETRDRFIQNVLKVLETTKKDTSRIDFDDMIWYPIVHNLQLIQYDYVFVDETQDLNNCQISMVLRSIKPNGRILTVGDSAQAIFSFRGADHNAINNIITRMNSKVLPLSVSYRCGKNIIREAQKYVPHIEYYEGAIDGLVKDIAQYDVMNMVKPGDFILSRINAPLITWCMNLIAENIPANIKGNDVAKGLLALIKNSKTKDLDGFLTYMQKWADIETARLTKLNREVGVVTDKLECMYALCEGCSDLMEVKKRIETLFYEGDDNRRVILSTTHKAKGLERDRVFMLNNTYKPEKSIEERNLTYVAITRAKKELYYVS